jgi:EAL domain-containing protein (putative c-di-GMP-specific phosphodiesterase class I)
MNVDRERRDFRTRGRDCFDRGPIPAVGGALRNAVQARTATSPPRARRRLYGLSPTTLIRTAMECHELTLHYQPQYEIGAGHQCGIEALARWIRPNGDSVPTSVFIRQAEQSGWIVALGAWVLHEACTTVAGWRNAGEQLPTLCVNVSPRQISAEFSTLLESTLERTGFPAGQLELEITEGILIEKPALALACLEQWKRLGVRIALDDFGTGYSSLSYLSRLPVDRIKIDRSLTSQMTDDHRTAAIVRAVVSLGADLGVTVLAEGVETEAQLTMLNDMGCSQAQGFLLAFPACADEARTLLDAPWGSRSEGGNFHGI